MCWSVIIQLYRMVGSYMKAEGGEECHFYNVAFKEKSINDLHETSGTINVITALRVNVTGLYRASPAIQTHMQTDTTRRIICTKTAKQVHVFRKHINFSFHEFSLFLGKPQFSWRIRRVCVCSVLCVIVSSKGNNDYTFH